MDWSKGFSSSCYAYLVDAATWRDQESFDLIDGSITRSNSTLIEAADLTASYDLQGERWIRIYMDTQQNGAAAHVALFTGLAISPSKQITNNVLRYSIECYSVLKPLEDVLLPRGYYVPAGTGGEQAITTLMEATPAPVVFEGVTPSLRSHVIAEDGENHLTMIIKVLRAVNKRIRIAGDGTITVCDPASEASAVFNALDNDSVEPTVSMTQDWFACPNVFRAVSDRQTAVARDDSEDSPLSTVSRGREVWAEETGVSLSDSEGIANYAKRRLLEEQSRAYEIKYSRRYDPDITISDIVSLNYPEQGLTGNYYVKSQQISLSKNGRTEEEVEYS